MIKERSQQNIERKKKTIDHVIIVCSSQSQGYKYNNIRYLLEHNVYQPRSQWGEGGKS